MNHKKKMNRRERIADYINQRMEGFSKVPNVLADRALKIGALSFLALFLGSYMGRQMDSASFIAWSVVMWLSGIGYISVVIVMASLFMVMQTTIWHRSLGRLSIKR